eukprot:COSAG01_NODE_3982_length_5467_cov_3.487891_4_plen_312_part_00
MSVERGASSQPRTPQRPLLQRACSCLPLVRCSHGCALSQRLRSLAAGHQEGRQGDGVRAVSDHRPPLKVLRFVCPAPPAAPYCTIRTEAVTEIPLRFCPFHLADRNGAACCHRQGLSRGRVPELGGPTEAVGGGRGPPPRRCHQDERRCEACSWLRTPAPSRPSQEGFDMPCTSAKLDCRVRGEITVRLITLTEIPRRFYVVAIPSPPPPGVHRLSCTHGRVFAVASDHLDPDRDQKPCDGQGGGRQAQPGGPGRLGARRQDRGGVSSINHPPLRHPAPGPRHWGIRLCVCVCACLRVRVKRMGLIIIRTD